MSKITVTNSHKRYKINERLIKKITEEILRELKEPANKELEIVFMDDRSIKTLNKKYKHKNRPTDVLSFALDDIGEIFISLDTALKNSRTYKTSLAEEATRYVIHGILHLFGYDDEKRSQRARMSRKEDDILGGLCAKEDLSKALTPR